MGEEQRLRMISGREEVAGALEKERAWRVAG
jgi:hypothetical protein